MNILHRYSNKEVRFRFSGTDLSFFLSQSLFSSFDIDAGTRLLLKSLAQNTDLAGMDTVIDAGCGTGVIGISLKRRYPEMQVIMQDRDALAVEFTKLNAEHNGIHDIKAETVLSLDSIQKGSADLIVSNIPAKAGGPVHRDFIRKALASLTVKGLCAVVIVHTLKEDILSAIKSEKAEILFREDTKEYSVFHFTNRKQQEKEEMVSAGEINEKMPASYIRAVSDFHVGKYSYRLKTVYNLPGFDTPPYYTETAVPLMEKYSTGESAFFWNPEQGHLPVLAILSGTGINEVTLASRDLLQLKISETNAVEISRGKKDIKVQTASLCCLETPEAAELISSNKLIFIYLEEPEDSVLQFLKEPARKGTILFVTGKSSYIARCLNNRKGWTPLDSGKYRGFRTAVLQRNS